MSGHTPGPWFADRDGRIWRRPPSDLYQNGGGVAGDKAVATAHRGWHGEGDKGFPVDANARLIAAAPELLEALRAILAFIPITSALEGGASAYSENVRAADKVRAAIAKATGGAK